jgi:hypothetical protein
VHAPFRALGSFAFCAVLVLASAAPLESVQAAAFPPGSQVEGHVGADWSPCTVVGDQLRTGGYVLHCDAVPDDNVFSATDVRQPAAAQQAPVGRPPAAGPQGRPVQGLIRGNWEDCAMIGNPLPTGGSVLHCDSLPDDTVFSASEVRQIGAAQPAQLNPPAAGLIGAAQVAPPPPAAPQGRPVQGLIRGNWEDCAMIGNPLPTGGYLLRCSSLLDDTVFSASEVREIGPAQAAAPKPPPAAAQGRPVQGFVRGNWENCTLIGNQLPTGGYLLRCASVLDDAVFSAADVRF